MTIATRLRQYLDNQGIGYDAIAHAPSSTSAGAAHACHVPEDRLAKPVVIHNDDGYLMAVVPCSHRVELGSVRALLGGHPGLATEAEIARLFDDCAPGAVPPLGAAYGMPMLVDESLDGADDLYMEGGDHQTLVHLGGDAFRSLTREARRARFSHPAGTA